MKLVSLSLVTALLLTGCAKQGNSADNAAGQLENAADQSDPAAARVLDNEAEALRAGGDMPGNSSDPEGAVQSAMENAGNAAAGNLR